MQSLAPFENWPQQSDMLKTLYNRLVQGTVPHTMLFVGEPQQTAELTSYLAQLLLCKGELSPCQQCDSCLQFKAGSHPDYVVLTSESSTTVKTAQVEQLQKQLMLRAHGGGRLVYVIPGIDNATPVAANRLLKTLEEPSLPVIALLTATSLGRVLPTIVSRSFLFRVSQSSLNLDWDDPLKMMLSDTVDPEGDSAFATFFKPVLQCTRDLLKRSEPALLLADFFVKETSSIELDAALQILSLWLRDVMHYGLGDLSHIRFRDFEADLREQATQRTTQQFAAMIEIVLDARTRLRAHVVPALNIEQMCLRLQEVK